jgi:signal transduction histidine kinase
MTRRLVLALLTLIVVIVVGSMVPLGLNAMGHDRNSFIQDTQEQVREDSAIAAPSLMPPVNVRGNSNNLSLAHVFSQVRATGDRLLILQNGKILHPQGRAAVQTYRVRANLGMPTGPWDSLASTVEKQSLATTAQPTISTMGSWMIAAFPIYPGVEKLGGPTGTIILARSTVPLDRAARTLWLILGAIGVAAILGATLMAIWLAQWVSKPLARLDTAASKLADGDLTTRAAAGGPPELRRLASTFNTMAGRLESLVHGSRAMLADVSHQLRTPLAALRLRLDLLAADAAETDPEMAAELAGAQDEVQRLSRMVDGLLAVARAENVLPQPKAIDVAEIAAERVSAWLPVAEDRAIELTAHGAEVVGWLGEGHLEQILDNLIANALDALSPGDRITVTAQDIAEGARITVSDNGPGMSEEERERAFLRFTTGSPGGTGLGLAIVHRLTTANGGQAALRPTPGGGLTIVIEFPGVPASASVQGEKRVLA